MKEGRTYVRPRRSRDCLCSELSLAQQNRTKEGLGPVLAGRRGSAHRTDMKMSGFIRQRGRRNQTMAESGQNGGGGRRPRFRGASRARVLPEHPRKPGETARGFGTACWSKNEEKKRPEETEDRQRARLEEGDRKCRQCFTAQTGPGSEARGQQQQRGRSRASSFPPPVNQTASPGDGGGGEGSDGCSPTISW